MPVPNITDPNPDPNLDPDYREPGSASSTYHYDHTRPGRAELASELAAYHGDTPQRAALAQLALTSIYSGIDELAKLGHVFELVRGSSQAIREYPKMMYHDDQAPGGREIESRVEQDALGDGWRDRPIPVEVVGKVDDKARAELDNGPKPQTAAQVKADAAQAGNKPGTADKK